MYTWRPVINGAIKTTNTEFKETKENYLLN